jgi:multiple antibiotic resistance protein
VLIVLILLFNMNAAEAFALFVKLFFLLTPPFVISVFLSVTKDASLAERRGFAVRITLAVWVGSIVLLFCGPYIFNLFGITLASFRVGTGLILLSTAFALVNGKGLTISTDANLYSLAVVPLAIPVTLGPASIGAIIVYGGELLTTADIVWGVFAIMAAIISVGALLWFATYIERALGKNGLIVLSKLTGLVLAALSCQMIFVGAMEFFKDMLLTVVKTGIQ